MEGPWHSMAEFKSIFLLYQEWDSWLCVSKLSKVTLASISWLNSATTEAWVLGMQVVKSYYSCNLCNTLTFQSEDLHNFWTALHSKARSPCHSIRIVFKRNSSPTETSFLSWSCVHEINDRGTESCKLHTKLNMRKSDTSNRIQLHIK